VVLKIRCRIDWTRVVVLIECALERCLLVVGRSAELLLLSVGIVEIVVVEILLLAPNPPCGESESTKQECTAHTSDNTTDDLLG